VFWEQKSYEKCSVRQVNMTISLAFLAPNLVKAAVEGRLTRVMASSGSVIRQAAAKSLRRILAWEFQQVVLPHGDPIDRNARAVAGAAWSGILER
jgi:hypothetical protein